MRSLIKRLGLFSNYASLLLCGGLLVFAPVARAQPIDPAVEYRIKAAYLFNFTKFVDWPPTAYAAAGSPFVIGVVDPVGTTAAIVASTLQGKTTPDGRTIEVRRFLSLTAEIATCQQLFITRASGIDPISASTALANAPVLLVGETEGFAEQGGVIGFVLSGDSVHCDVNLAGAQRAGVKLSGRLGSVARLVRETRRK